MLCPRCEKSIPDDALFCCYCARVIVKSAPAHPHTRGNGTGFAFKRGKTWTALLTVGWRVDDKGKKQRVNLTKGGFKSKNEAIAYIPMLTKKGEAARRAPDLLYYWNTYENGEYAKLSKSKQTAYKIAWGKMKSIKYRRVDALTVNDLRSVVSENASTYYPAKDMKTVLGKLFLLAGADGWVRKELPDYIILPELHEKERIPFNDEEQASLWRLYESGDTRAFLPLVLIYTGMMPGELQELKADMIDLPARQIRGNGLKTKIRRESPIYIPDVIIPLLETAMENATPMGYIVTHNETKFYEDYYSALEAAGCRRLTPYSCRHTTATALAITENIAPQTIKKVMRWTSTKMLDRYAHPDHSDALEAINKIKK